MTTAIIAVLGILMVSAAILALLHKSLVTAILAAGVVSLVASIIYLFLAAPDVAMTEAAIGSALTTIIFLFALSRLRERAPASSTSADGNPAGGEDSDGK